MIVNIGSTLDDIRQALQGTWNNVTDDGWNVIELGTIKFYKKMCKAGKNVLPSTFINNRTSVIGYLAFTKDAVKGGAITLQDQYVELDSNALVIIINI